MKLSYHDVEVEYDGMRYRLSDSSFNLELTCTRFGGWQLWDMSSKPEVFVAGEYDEPRLTVYSGGFLVCGES